MALRLVRPRFRGGIALALLAAASVVHAQGASAPAQRPDPLDPQARVPAVTYQSPLANYRRLGEDTRVPWREANETVNRIGGWRAYAREAQQPEAKGGASGESVAPAPAPSVTPAHGGHKSH